MTGLTAEIAPARSRPNLAADWLDLQVRADHSFFQSWGWVGTWLDWLPARLEPLCLTVRAGREVLGLGLLCPARTRRRRIIVCRRLQLSETGDPAYDRLAVECSGFLVDRRRPADISRAAFEGLARQKRDWDELVLPGIDDATLGRVQAWGWPVRIEKRSTALYVDLRALGAAPYLAALSANTRQQIARACRLSGSVALCPAETRQQAAAFLARLRELHQATWEARDEPGAFAGEAFADFHQRLVAGRFEAGDIQLLRVRGASGDLGVLYNFVYRGWVYNYQSGLAVSDDNRLKPGLVSHAQAVDWNRRLGHRAYDLMAGAARYKQSLSNAHYHLVWAAVQRDNSLFRLERLAGRLRERWTVSSRTETK